VGRVQDRRCKNPRQGVSLDKDTNKTDSTTPAGRRILMQFSDSDCLANGRLMPTDRDPVAFGVPLIN